jgi:glycosyltransferase 2 family protein
VKKSFTVLKLAATILILWFVFDKLEFKQLVLHVTTWQVFYALLVGSLGISLQTFLSALRFRACTHMVGHQLTNLNAWIACLLGGLFSHTPLSIIGGDVVRVMHVTKSNLHWSDATKAVLLDRYLGFLGLMFWVIVSTPLMLDGIKDTHTKTGYWLLLSVGLLAAVGFLMLGFVPEEKKLSGKFARLADFTLAARYLFRQPKIALSAFTLAVIINAFNLFIIWIIGLIYESDISLLVFITAIPMAFLVSMIPISIAGWGVREGAFLISLGIFGVSSELSLIISVTFGLSVLIAYTPALLWVFNKKK